MATKALLGSLILVLASGALGRAGDLPPEYNSCIQKGLGWLVKQQFPDGHWESGGDRCPTTMTALSGMALLMEGSTLRDGKYSENIRRAVDWLLSRCMNNGMIGNPYLPGEAGRYMYGHGFSLMFLASAYGGLEDGIWRRRLGDVLVRAVTFSSKAQTSRGGWGSVAAEDGRGFDEGAATIVQIQALRAARDAGFTVSQEALNGGIDYLRRATSEKGGVSYSLVTGGSGTGLCALTAAAIACAFGMGDYESDTVKKWIKFCRKHILLGAGGRIGHDGYTHYYYAQAMYYLGEDRYAKLFPGSGSDEWMTWSKYRKAVFDNLMYSQSSDGSWNSAGVGPVYTTALYLAILQLDNGTLPVYQR